MKLEQLTCGESALAMPDKNKLADLPNELLVWFPEWSEKSNYNNNSNKFGKSNAAIWLISFILLSLIHCWLYFMNQQTEIRFSFWWMKLKTSQLMNESRIQLSQMQQYNNSTWLKWWNWREFGLVFGLFLFNWMNSKLKTFSLNEFNKTKPKQANSQANLSICMIAGCLLLPEIH